MKKEAQNKIKNIKIIPAITTTRGSDWRAKIKEADELGLTEIALFPTVLGKEKREELYRLLGRSNIKSIPFVHLRSDMEFGELDYFTENYGTKAFCIHTEREFPFSYDYSKSKYNNSIFIENVYFSFDEAELKRFGGICLDISHLENDRRLNREIFDSNAGILSRCAIGCNHISAVSESTYIDETGRKRCSPHRLSNFSELDYLKNYPLEYFSPYIAIELEDSLKRQTEARDYIAGLISELK